MKIIKGILKFLLAMILTLCILVAGVFIALKINDSMNDKVHVTKYTYADPDLPEGFQGYTYIYHRPG